MAISYSYPLGTPKLTDTVLGIQYEDMKDPAVKNFSISDIAILAIDEIGNIAQGPVGPQGPVGAQGVQGNPGTPGAVGPAGLEWQGEWDLDASYNVNDAVGFAGASYFCILNVDTTSNPFPDEDTTHWALLAAQGAQGIQGVQGATGAQGPIGSSAPLTNAAIAGGTFSSPTPITVDVLTTALISNSDNYYSVPNYTNDQTKIGKKIYIRNNTFFAAQIKGAPGVNATFYTNTTVLPNGYEAFQSPLLLTTMRTTELTYLGHDNGYERWSSHLAFTPRPQTNGNYGTVSLSLINSSNVNSNINVVTPVNATDNYIKLFTSYANIGDSIIVANTSTTIDIRLLQTPLWHYVILGLDYNTVPYVIPAGKSVRFTKGPSDFYFIAEVISYD
jgi:hypothetical protein